MKIHLHTTPGTAEQQDEEAGRFFGLFGTFVVLLVVYWINS